MTVRIKRVYEPAEEADGFRVLVDRLWPRGETKEKARVDLWLKEVAPSTDLRHWFHHEERLFDEFAERYRAELDANGEAVRELRDVVGQHPVVTLVYGAKDEEHNQAVVLRDYLAATGAS
ncbi:MAG: MarR family transcriptional regulator [Cellulosimicrobium sp.]|jgi:DNA-3-methyladenine glycosylase|nr:MarR family transcriptional regulator [Cellulosimicrobium sp.]